MLELELSASFSDDEVLNIELDMDENYFNNACLSLAENRPNRYYTNEFFNRLTAHGTKKNLSILHVNVIFLKANGAVLASYLSTLNRSFDIVCFTETLLDDQSIVLNDFFPQCLSFSFHRNGRRGGGSAVYIERNFDCSMILDLTHNLNHVESVFVRLLL